MAVLKRDVTAQPGAKWNLVYDLSRHELYVEIHSNGAVKGIAPGNVEIGGAALLALSR